MTRATDSDSLFDDRNLKRCINLIYFFHCGHGIKIPYHKKSEPNDLQNIRKQEYNIRQTHVNITNDDNWYKLHIIHILYFKSI